jgi:predicted PurR-regulated permease PerM
VATTPRRSAETAAAEAAAAAEESKQAARASEQAAAVAIEAADDDDPLLDTAVRQLEAGVTDDKPFGELGAPIAPRSPFRIAFGAALGVGVAYVLGQAVVAARQVLILLLISGFLAIGLNPPVEALQRRGMSRRQAVMVVIGTVLTFFVAFAIAVVPPIANQANDFVKDLPNRIAQLQENDTVRDLDERFGLLDEAKQAALDATKEGGGLRIAGGVLGVGTVVLSTTFSVFTVLILTLYFLSSYPGMKRAAYRLVPRSRRARVGLLADEILNRIGGYVAGALTIAAIAGVTSAVFLSVIGVPFAIALAMVIAILDLVPLVGATIGAAIATLVAFTVSPTVGLTSLAFYVAYQQIENYVIYPRVMRRTVDVSPAATIVAILVGAALLGILGALLAIPVAAAIQLIGSEVVVPRQDQA